MMYSETFLDVRYYETDQMGVVHHSNYIRYFECARNVLMAQGGFPIQVCESEGVTIPVVSVECRYRHPAIMGDTLRVTAEIDEPPLAKLCVRQQVFNQNDELCAEGKVILGFLDKSTGRPVRCPEKMLKLIKQHINDK